MRIDREYNGQELYGVHISETVHVRVYHDDGPLMSYSTLCVRYDQWEESDTLQRPEGYIHSVRTYDEYQNQGIGTAMFKELIAAAEEYGCEDVWLHVSPRNEPAQRLYYKYGFRPEYQIEGPYRFTNGASILRRPVWGGES